MLSKLNFDINTARTILDFASKLSKMLKMLNLCLIYNNLPKFYQKRISHKIRLASIQIPPLEAIKARR